MRVLYIFLFMNASSCMFWIAHFLRFCVSFQSFITCLVRWGRCEYLNHATAQQSWGISCSKHWMSWWQAGPRLSLGVGLFLHKRSKKGCTLDGVEDVTPQRKRSWLTVVVGCTCLLHGIQENCNFCNSSGHCSSFVNRHQRHQILVPRYRFMELFFLESRLQTQNSCWRDNCNAVCDSFPRICSFKSGYPRLLHPSINFRYSCEPTSLGWYRS